MEPQPSLLSEWDAGALAAIFVYLVALTIIINSRIKEAIEQVRLLKIEFDVLRSTDHVKLTDFRDLSVELVSLGKDIASIKARQEDVIARLDRLESRIIAHINADAPR